MRWFITVWCPCWTILTIFQGWCAIVTDIRKATSLYWLGHNILLSHEMQSHGLCGTITHFLLTVPRRMQEAFWYITNGCKRRGPTKKTTRKRDFSKHSRHVYFWVKEVPSTTTILPDDMGWTCSWSHLQSLLLSVWCSYRQNIAEHYWLITDLTTCRLINK
jgi:hypothetical protein